MTSRTFRRAPALLLSGILLAALALLLFMLAPIVGQPRRVVVVLIVGIVLDVGLYLLLRREPTLSPRMREVVGLVVLGVFVIAIYGLVVWASAATLIQGMGWVALIVGPWVVVIVAGVVALADRRHGRRRSIAIDPVRLIIVASVVTAASFIGGRYEVWSTFRREPGTVAASVLTLATAAVLIVVSRLRPDWYAGRPGLAVPSAESIPESDRSPRLGVAEAVAPGPAWLEYVVVGVAIVVVLFFSLSFMNSGHISTILAPVESYPPVAPSY